MATLIEQYNKAKKITPDIISQELFSFIKRIEHVILEDNRKQLQNSKDVDNEQLVSKRTGRSTYSPYTEMLTGGKKKAGDSYDLFDKGSWQLGFYLDIKKDQAIFKSKDYKSASLVLEFGDVFGLTDEKLEQRIREDFLPFVQNYIRKGLGI